MEALLIFLYSASVSMALFFVLYWVLLRKLTDFHVNRFFLLASLLISVLIAAFPVRYEAVAPPAGAFTLKALVAGPEAGISTSGIPVADRFSSTAVFIMIYMAGATIFMLRLIIQTSKMLLIIFRTETMKTDNCYVHENTRYILPFSFFNHVFINPEFHKKDDLDDILSHEKVHIRERHWIDLLFIELLTALFWFNPFIWFFEHAIKQNHEYLADEGVLARGRSVARYQALLVNQLMGMKVIGLTNHLTFALGPNRLNMMNKQKTHRKKLLRLVWMAPVIAGLMTAFAEPEYNSVNQNSYEANTSLRPKRQKEGHKTISGTVTTESDKPLPGTSVVIRGTSTGTLTDEQGNFSLEIPETNSVEIVLSYVGYKSIVAEIAPRKDQQWNFKMERETIGIDTKSMFLEKEMPAPPPPPVARPPLPAGQSGSDTGKEIFVIVEEMPEYPGGHYALGQYVRKKQQELKINSPDLKGKAMVSFTIDEKGKVTNIQTVEKTDEQAAEALKTIVAGMGDWSPGTQRGKAVPVDFEIQLEF
ncbi:MAG: carboxypeptidase-like regulatory domain-containing protein [Prolixibacteraceae bacterium]